MSSLQELEAKYRSASKGFDHLFSNQLISARETFSEQESPFHLLGLGVCAFLEAALGMETTLMAEATRCLTLSEAGARKQVKAAKSSATLHRFQAGIEWEILHADAVVLLGLTHALSESYRGYLQCLYELNSAHSKFTKLYKTVYPAGFDAYSTPATTPKPSPKPSTLSLNSLNPSATTQASTKSGFFGRWTGSNTLSVPTAAPGTVGNAANGTIEELILGGTAFGFGLFNLVFSLLPAKVRGVVGFFGFNHDRKLALQALAVSAARVDVHAVFAGLVLMTYHGVILLMSGYQADEAHIIKQYKAIVEKIGSRYPTGALWILNRAKILRMTHDAEGAIKTLQDGLKPEREHSFSQADTLLVFELAWTLLAQRRFEESSEMFIRMTELNTWSHATYYFIAAGCQFSLQNYDKAQELFDKIPDLLDKRKLSGKDLPTEVFIKKKIAYYKKKQQRRGGAEGQFVEAMKISPAEEIAIFWNAHARIDKDIAIAHIKDWSSLSPPVNVESAYIVPAASPTSGPADLDTADELAVRSLLLAIVHRTLCDYSASRAFLADAQQQAKTAEISSWVSSLSIFELAVLELKEADATCLSKALVSDERKKFWIPVLKAANEKLDQALALATSNTDLSSRLDSRISMLRDEITTKSEMIGIV